MRDVLIERVRPLVERLAANLTELAVARVEAELERMTEAFEVALSAYQSDEPSDLITKALGPELGAMLNAKPEPLPSVPAKRDRDYKPENYPPSRRAREERTELQANGKRPVTCTKCGFVGGNARGCGTAHETKAHFVPPPRAKAEPDAKPLTAITPTIPRRPSTAELDAARARSKARVARIAERAEGTRPGAKPSEPDIYEDDEPLADRIARAEANKHEGQLPEPIATFEFGVYR